MNPSSAYNLIKYHILLASHLNQVHVPKVSRVDIFSNARLHLKNVYASYEPVISVIP